MQFKDNVKAHYEINIKLNQYKTMAKWDTSNWLRGTSQLHCRLSLYIGVDEQNKVTANCSVFIGKQMKIIASNVGSGQF